VAATSLHEALARAADWERHHASTIPRLPPLPAKKLEEHAADAITTFAGSMPFVYLHTALVWPVDRGQSRLVTLVGLNLLQPFDPFPFGLLTMIRLAGGDLPLDVRD